MKLAKLREMAARMRKEDMVCLYRSGTNARHRCELQFDYKDKVVPVEGLIVNYLESDDGVILGQDEEFAYDFQFYVLIN